MQRNLSPRDNANDPPITLKASDVRGLGTQTKMIVDVLPPLTEVGNNMRFEAKVVKRPGSITFTAEIAEGLTLELRRDMGRAAVNISFTPKGEKTRGQDWGTLRLELLEDRHGLCIAHITKPKVDTKEFDYEQKASNTDGLRQYMESAVAKTIDKLVCAEGKPELEGLKQFFARKQNLCGYTGVGLK
jgi:hypothetical protein